MQTLTRTAHLLWDALFLRHEAYQTLKDDDNPFVEGLYILVILGLVLALAGIVGTTLEWASNPSLNDIQRTVLRNLQSMPWWEQLQEMPDGDQAIQMFQQIWDAQWQFISLVSPGPLSSLAGVVTVPLGLIISWLIFGLIAHLLARLLGGTGNLGQTLGTTALATAPQMLNLFGVLPFVVVAGISTWTLICRYMALRTAHDLSWPRAVWAALLPPIILGVAIALIVGLGVVLFGAGLAAMIEGGLQ